MKMEGKTAVVTGASTGIGRAIAIAIGAKKARVALVGRNMDDLLETQAVIRNSGGKAEIFITDLKKSREIEILAKEVRSRWGSVDILANIAGAWHDKNNTYFGYLHDRSVDEIDEGIDVNLRAPMLLSRLFVPEMIAKKQGKIINLSGVFPEFGYKHIHYYVSKTAVETFSIGLATELRKHNVQVNCISPGETNTKAIRKFFPEYKDKAIRPDIVAKLTLFFLENEAADYITGEVIVVGYDGTFWDWDKIVSCQEQII